MDRFKKMILIKALSFIFLRTIINRGVFLPFGKIKMGL